MLARRKSAKSAAGNDAIQRRREISAGGVIWRRVPVSGTIEVVMIRPAGKEAWTLPKGQVGKGESLLEAAVRESREETGLEVVPGARVGDISYVYSWHDTPGSPLVRIFKRVYYYLMEPRGGDFARHDSEIDEAAWVAIEEAIRRANHGSDKEILRKARVMLAGEGGS